MRVYKVGGFVRDYLLNIKSNDVDWVVVDSTPRDMVEQGFIPVGKDFPVFLHPDTREEYALARKESKRGVGYHGFSFETDNVTLEDDLFRRDITINALAMNDSGTIIDPYNGKKDLYSRTIKHVSDHFKEDPLRVLRVARFQSKFPNFSIHESTITLMKEIVKSGELSTLTPERINMEMYKALACPKPSLFFEILKKIKALEVVFPEVHALIDVPQTEEYHPEGCCYTHTMLVLDKCKPDPKLKLAALVHDFGKALTPTDILPKHYGHDDEGIPVVTNFCDRLRISKEHTRFCYLVTKYHIRSHNIMEARSTKVVRILKDMRALHDPTILEDFISVCEADQQGKLSDEPYKQGEYLRECLIAVKDTPVDEIAKKYSGSKHLTDMIEQVQSYKIKVLKRQFNMNRVAEIFEQKREIIARMNKYHPDKKLVGLIIAGSHFFDMDTPNSDLDFRGIYLPSGKDAKKGQLQYKTAGNNTRNTKDDVDVDLYSVYKFTRLLANGDFNMMEFLFAPADKILIDSEIYKWLRSIRSSFITKNISPFIGFIKKEYNRYGISGDHYNAQAKFLELTKNWDPKSRIKHHWDKIEEYAKEETNLVRITKSRAGKDEWVRSFVIAHRLFQDTVRVDYVAEEIRSKLERYGHRKKNRQDGADYKGLYHAKRLIYEATDIVKDGTLHLPFSQKRHNELMNIKSGNANVDELGESISADIEFLRSYDYTDEGRAEYVRDLADRISNNIKSEVEIRSLTTKEKLC